MNSIVHIMASRGCKGSDVLSSVKEHLAVAGSRISRAFIESMYIRKK